MSELLEKYDNWLKDDSDVAALVMRQWLVPVEGKDAVIFPPTYTLADTEAGERFNKGERIPGVYKGQKGPMGYNIDWFEDGTSVCQIDSVGSQANRMEPIFMREAYKELVPEVIIKAGDKEVNLLEAGHRAADAVVRFSDLREKLEEAFNAVRAGDATKLAKIAPTSLVFGVWDSRGTQVKLPRVVRSVIRAFKVRPLHRSAQYIPAIDYVGSGLLDAPGEKKQQDAMSELGLSHAPAPWSHGGVLVEQEIRRDAVLNVVALRALRAGRDADPLPLRRYILGLSLVAFTAPQETFLREGCQLVPDPDLPPEWWLVKHDGSREANFRLSGHQALEYARKVAEAFGVGPRKEATFHAEKAREELGQSKQERKKARRAKVSEVEANQ
ncbi:MAG: type I-U CRISPR-associated protein Cas7 [Candidatus Binatia bacterium]|nr:MAG: type I-U CRISPR-associated protein Cas7 [Candidatus Binatia bacterium]